MLANRSSLEFRRLIFESYYLQKLGSVSDLDDCDIRTYAQF